MKFTIFSTITLLVAAASAAMVESPFGLTARDGVLVKDGVECVGCPCPCHVNGVCHEEQRLGLVLCTDYYLAVLPRQVRRDLDSYGLSRIQHQLSPDKETWPSNMIAMVNTCYALYTGLKLDLSTKQNRCLTEYMN